MLVSGELLVITIQAVDVWRNYMTSGGEQFNVLFEG